VHGGAHDLTSRFMGDPGRYYAGYLEGALTEADGCRLSLGNGDYALTWLDPVACKTIDSDVHLSGGGDSEITFPGGHSGELAVLITRQNTSR
jgi:hypothetical protein